MKSAKIDDFTCVPRETNNKYQSQYQRFMKKELLLAHLRNIPDFPKPGIQFKDVSTLFKDRTCLKEMREELVRLYAHPRRPARHGWFDESGR